MKIAFLQETVNQNIGIMYLSSLLKAQGHSVELFLEPLESDFLPAVTAFRPEVIGFSVITGAHHWVVNVARQLKAALPAVTTVAGGAHPTYFPDMVREEPIDIIARGEAEISFPEFVMRLSSGRDYRRTPGLWVKDKQEIYQNDVAPLVDDLSSLPHPDRELYLKYSFYRQQSEVPFSTTRGCPFHCSFCYNHVKAALYRGKGKYVRTRTVEDVISEMEAVRRLSENMRSVILYDDIIGLDKKWLAEFCEVYAQRINLPWFTSIRADFVDPEVAENLARANCFCLSLGVETGDEDLREKVLCKRISNDVYLKASLLLHQVGIKVRTSNMLFLPGEDVQKALKTVDLNRAMGVDFPWAYTLQPYPGTDIFDYAVKHGYLSPAFQFDDIDPLGLVKPIVRLQDEHQLLVVHRFFYAAVRNNLMRRLLKFLMRLPPNPSYDCFYYFSLVLSYKKYHQVSLPRALRVAWNNYWSTRKP
jgi:anaerobic magnesium-protoporphyrin IX monomethyl ester cyclase